MLKLGSRVEAFVKKNVYGSKETMEFLLLFLLVYAMLDAIILAWFFSAPILVQSENRLALGLGMLAYNIGYLTSNCHQMPERSIIIAGVEMPFCSRDTAIYVGCLIGAAAPFLLKTPKYVKSLSFAAALMVPMAADGVSQTIFSMRESSNLLRIATGLLFGYGMVYYFAVRIADNTKGRVRSEAVKVARIGAVAVLILLAAGYAYGGGWVTKKQAIEKSGLNPTYVTYASKRALHMIHFDPFFDSYQDPILSAMYQYGPQDGGAWIVYEGPISNEGKYAYLSGTGGKIRMIPALSST